MRWLISLLLFPHLVSTQNEAVEAQLSASIWNGIDEVVSATWFDWPYHVDRPQEFPVALGSALGVNSVQELYWTSVLSYCDHSIVFDPECNLFVCTHSALQFGYSNATFFNDYGEQNQASVFMNPSENQVLESWKATTGWSLVEWLKNAIFHQSERYCEQCGVHAGFHNHYLVLKPGVDAKTAGLLQTLSSPKLIVTGFSLGSAQATFSAFNSRMTYHNSAVDVQGFVYGAPRTGNDKFGEYVFSYCGDDKLFRFQNWKDMIGFVPFRVLGFRSVGSEVWFARNHFEFEFTPFSKFVDKDYSTGSNNLGFYFWADSIMTNALYHTLFFGEAQMETVNACGGVGAMNSNVNSSKPLFYGAVSQMMDEMD